MRFITTYAVQGDTCITVLDTGDISTDVSHVGDLWSEHDELAAVLAGASLETNVLSADEYGVWVSQCVPLRNAQGTVVGALTVDEAAVETIGHQELHGDLSQGLASMLQTAALRYSRAELEAITDGLTGLYNHRYLHERLEEEIDKRDLEEIPASRLHAIAAQLRAEINRETTTPVHFSESINNIPSEESRPVCHEWNA